MYRTPLVAAVFAPLALSLAAAAPRDEPRLAIVEIQQARLGAEEQFETARIEHMKWHRDHEDPWTWRVWAVAAGAPDRGYYVATFGHRWEDLDARVALQRQDHDDASAKLTPSLESNENSYWLERTELSRPAEPGAPPPYLEVRRFRLQPGAREEFVGALRRVREATDKTGRLTPYSWYELVLGGPHPTFELWIGHDDFAGIRTRGPLSGGMIEQAYPGEAGAIRRALTASILEETSVLLRYRDDLSYVPAERRASRP
ncbi:MAG TPA: hypothetical protein VJS92_06330 [Candidatus Polarisedimenticolaceae bacterium]|nr:hypothetical protein [Candidatus Polarisedimenticolaceae bacterium]